MPPYIVYYNIKFSRLTLSNCGGAEDIGNIGSSEISVFPIPRILKSFTKTLRFGIENPNSVRYLN